MQTCHQGGPQGNIHRSCSLCHGLLKPHLKPRLSSARLCKTRDGNVMSKLNACDQTGVDKDDACWEHGGDMCHVLQVEKMTKKDVPDPGDLKKPLAGMSQLLVDKVRSCTSILETQ